MNWNETLQKIIDTLEVHLQKTEDPVDTDAIAKTAGCSVDFFQKIFSYMNGISFAEYIRFRKMTLAGYDIRSSSAKIIDLSCKYGYDSPTAFTRTFRQFHGVSPTEARGGTMALRVYPKMQLVTDTAYSWKLEQRPTFRLIGKSITLTRTNNMHYQSIPEFWSACQRNSVFSKLVSMDRGDEKGIFGLFSNSDTPDDSFEYSIMVNSDCRLPEGFCEVIIPESTWAVFDCQGPVPWAVQNGWKYLNEEWLTTYPFKHAACPELEWYSDGNTFDEGYLSRIMIPILQD